MKLDRAVLGGGFWGGGVESWRSGDGVRGGGSSGKGVGVGVGVVGSC